LKRAAHPEAATTHTLQLPKTASEAELKMILGVIFLIFSLVLFAFNRRQALIP
jgi:Ca-activated chloride channel family protein